MYPRPLEIWDLVYLGLIYLGYFRDTRQAGRWMGEEVLAGWR